MNELSNVFTIYTEGLSNSHYHETLKNIMWLEVIKDMEERRVHGIEKYGKPVQPFNGRDPLIDLYQELLDACVYTRQAIEERSAIVAKEREECAKLIEEQSRMVSAIFGNDRHEAICCDLAKAIRNRGKK